MAIAIRIVVSLVETTTLLGFDASCTMKLICDNQVALQTLQNPMFNERTNHIELDVILFERSSYIMIGLKTNKQICLPSLSVPHRSNIFVSWKALRNRCSNFWGSVRSIQESRKGLVVSPQYCLLYTYIVGENNGQ